MHVIAYDPYANPALCEAASVTLKNSLDELLMAADFFTIHTPLIASTKVYIYPFSRLRFRSRYPFRLCPLSVL